jgi:quinol monooxygenase YgiN
MFHSKVEDYAKWRGVFESNVSMRKEAGSKGGYVFQSNDNPNEIVIFLQWEDLDKARAFTSSDALRDAMQKAGIAGPPTIVFLDEVGRPEA